MDIKYMIKVADEIFRFGWNKDTNIVELGSDSTTVDLKWAKPPISLDDQR